MNKEPFAILNVTDLASVTGGNAAEGQAACTNLVENLKTTISVNYPNDDHAYAQKRMNSFGPALDAAKQNCLRRERADGDMPKLPGE